MGGVFRLERTPVSGAPYFELIGSDGNRRWSSNDKLFRTTDVLIGSVTKANRATPIDTVTTTTIGSCDPTATFVHGYMKFSNVGTAEDQFSPFTDVGDWYDAGGSYVGFPSVGVAGVRLDDCIVLTFLASGGTVTLEEQLVCYEIRNEFGQVFPFPGYTLDYELWITTFA